jgi:hypothetical protein
MPIWDDFGRASANVTAQLPFNTVAGNRAAARRLMRGNANPF